MTSKKLPPELKHPRERDACISFDEASHIYTVTRDGKPEVIGGEKNPVRTVASIL